MKRTAKADWSWKQEAYQPKMPEAWTWVEFLPQSAVAKRDVTRWVLQAGPFYSPEGELAWVDDFRGVRPMPYPIIANVVLPPDAQMEQMVNTHAFKSLALAMEWASNEAQELWA